MKCPHCTNLFHPQKHPQRILCPNQTEIYGELSVVYCPGCKKPIIFFKSIGPCAIDPEEIIFPIGKAVEVPPQVPSHIGQDYVEACQILSLSPKASAALARRCLQVVLREQGYTQYGLKDQIEALLSEKDARKNLPSYIHQAADCIRHYGNFSAHASTDKITLQIVDVEPKEAEFCLDILKGLFDYYYVKPVQAKEYKNNLNKKLAAVGKPLMQ